jgi:hypothetical protein
MRGASLVRRLARVFSLVAASSAGYGAQADRTRLDGQGVAPEPVPTRDGSWGKRRAFLVSRRASGFKVCDPLNPCYSVARRLAVGEFIRFDAFCNLPDGKRFGVGQFDRRRELRVRQGDWASSLLTYQQSRTRPARADACA